MTPETFDPSKLSRDDRETLIACLATCMRRHQQRLFHTLYLDEDTVWHIPGNKHFAPGDTVYRRELYQKHLEFFRAGREYRERCFMAANRTGKTLGGGYEVACHLTGLYPDWWEGRRFESPTRVWAAGRTNETTRDIIQETLLGEITHRGARKVMSGTGVVPGALLGQPSWKQGVQDLVDTIKVKHVTGGWSTLGFKAYNQGRGSFEGTEPIAPTATPSSEGSPMCY